MEIRKFPISSFGVILGTGGLALASQTFVPYLTLLLTYLLSAVFVLFTGLLAIKAIKYPGTVKAELQHPGPGNFYALQPISAVILSILYRKLLPSPVDVGLLVYGGVLILVLAVYLPYHFFADMNVEFSQIHGGWFITPVATILVTNAILLYPVSELSLIVSLLYLGIGSALFLLVLSVLFYRLLSHDLPTADLAPTNFIMLAPIGILVVDILQVSSATGSILGTSLTPIATLVGVGLWGFGIWAVLVNILLIRKYVQSGFSFHMGWWSYVFPTAAFTLGTLSLSRHLQTFGPVSSFSYLCLVTVWIVVSLGSLTSWLKSTVLSPKPAVTAPGRLAVDPRSRASRFDDATSIIFMHSHVCKSVNTGFERVLEMKLAN